MFTAACGAIAMNVSNVHPTILLHLPRFGDQVGLIPDTPAGRLLYRWLAAFNACVGSSSRILRWSGRRTRLS